MENSLQIMFFSIHPYAFFSVLSVLITLIASFVAWRRSAPGSFALSLLLLAMAVWSGCYATRWLEISTEAKIFWFRMMFTGVATLPTLFLVFALGFSRNEFWLTRQNLLLVSIQPAISLLLQWTNDYHHLLYTDLRVIQMNGVMAFELVRGPWYLFNVIYSYAMIGIGIFLINQGALRSGPLYRYQSRLILAASLLPWCGNIINEVYFGSSGDLDIAPLTFGVSGVIFALAVLRTRFMELIPVARSHLIETMGDGILVLDAQNRIVDLNPAMENFIQGKAVSLIGKDAFDVLRPWMENTDLFLNETETRSEMTVPLDPSRYLDLRVTPLYDQNQFLNGRLMVFRDITERKQVE